MEEWKAPALGLIVLNRYLINQQGEIKSSHDGDICPVHATITSAHYPYVKIAFLYEGNLISDFIHRIIWRTFKGSIPDNHDIFYIDFDHGFELSNLIIEEL